jgi:hypothetical protein
MVATAALKALRESHMDRPALLKKLEVLLDEAARTHAWVLLEIDVRNGIPTMLRKNQTERLIEEQKPNVKSYR